jgi:hypothetical protein
MYRANNLRIRTSFESWFMVSDFGLDLSFLFLFLLFWVAVVGSDAMHIYAASYPRWPPREELSRRWPFLVPDELYHSHSSIVYHLRS